jgi:HNH endonuclease
MPIPECGCSAWLGKIGTHGYPQMAYREGGKRRHRKVATVVYELANGPVPPGKEVSHSCKQEWCVSEPHLLAETHSENLKRRRPFSRFKGNLCKRGHPLPPKEQRNKNGSCPTCYKEYQAQFRVSRRAME